MKQLIFLVFALTSCSYGIYAPANQNVPLFHKKGEAQLEISTGYLQGAVAVGKHTGLITNLQFANGTKFLNPYAGVTNHRRVEVGAGYFRQQTANPKISYEAYAGVGYGWLRWGFGKGTEIAINADSSRAYPDLNGNIIYTAPNWNVFVQPAIGYRGGKAGIALSAKLNYIAYGAAQQRPYNALYGSGGSTLFVANFANLPASPQFRIEPALTLHTGRKRVRFALQTFCNFPIPGQRSQWPKYDGNVLNLRAYFIRMGLTWQLYRFPKTK